MAIARDSSLFAQATTGTSLTFSFNNAAGDVLYVFGNDTNTAGATKVTGVTYGGVAMTKINELDANGSFNDRALSVWRLIAPATGANNVVVTASVSTVLRFNAVSYTGVHQTTPENGTDTSTGATGSTSISTDITTTEDNCWMVMFSKDQNGNRTYSNSTGDSIIRNTDAGGQCVTDTNGAISPAGSNTITNTMSSVNGVGAVAWAIRPAAAAATFTPRVSFFM